MGATTERVSAAYYAEIGRSDSNPVLDPEEEKRLLRRWQDHDDVAARDRVIATHLRFVVKQARGRTKDPEAVKDYIAAGNLGLLEAANRFNWRRRPYVRFLTFAGWWVLKEMSEFDYSSSTIVHVPPHRQKQQRRNARAYKAAVHAHGPDSAIVRKMDPGRREGVTISMHATGQGTDRLLDAGNDLSIAITEKLPGRKVEIDCDAKRIQDALRGAIAGLPHREQTVLNLYFGVKDAPRNLRQIAAMMEMSDELVRQLKIRGIQQLHEALKGRIDPAALSS